MESVGTKMGALAPYIRRRRHSRWGKWVRAMAHITLRSYDWAHNPLFNLHRCGEDFLLARTVVGRRYPSNPPY